MKPAVCLDEERPCNRPRAASFASGRDVLYRRILVPVSEGSASAAGVMQAIRLAVRAGARLRFIHVLARTAGPVAGVDDVASRRVRRPPAAVEAAQASARAAGLECDLVLRDGAACATSDAIVAEALDWAAELIVIGAESHGRAGLRPGSVGARILQGSTVPVMAISARVGAPFGPARALMRAASRERTV